jgi:hypothetical protein
MRLPEETGYMPKEKYAVGDEILECTAASTSAIWGSSSGVTSIVATRVTAERTLPAVAYTLPANDARPPSSDGPRRASRQLNCGCARGRCPFDVRDPRHRARDLEERTILT